jgi:hypothetical protein
LGRSGVIAEGKDSMTGDRGATMMFVGYAKHKSDSVRMWDSCTTRFIVRDVIWLKRMFFKNDASGVIDLDTFGAIEDDLASELVTGLGSGDGSGVMNKGPTGNQPYQLGDGVTWASPLVNTPSEVCTTHPGRIIRIPDRLMYAPAVESRYLGEMVELDKVELANMYMCLRSMELALIGAGVMVAQDMFYMYRLLESLELEVELPMVLKMDNSGAVNIANSWSVGGRMHHVDVRNYFL